MLSHGSPSTQENERYTYGLLERLKGGDREAADELFSFHREPLRRAIRAHLPREFRFVVDEEETLQATLCRALERLGRFEWRGKGAFLAWLVGIAVNLLREEAARAAAARKQGPPGASSAGDGQRALDNLTERDSRSPSRVAERLEDWRLLEDALDQLDEQERAVLVRHKILEQGYRTLAEDLGITERVARARVTRAMNKLARWIEKRV